jgi:RNA polymerase subunit RPABC4/transcription elongation factor Spt4
MFCANCGTKIEEGIKFCSGCGKAVSGVSNEPVAAVVQQQTAVVQPRPMADEKYCSSCGAVIKKLAEICPKCGVKQGTAGTPTGKRNTLLLISAIIGSVLVVFLVGRSATILITAYWESPESSYYIFYFLPIIIITLLLITATILTYIAWAKSKKSYALIGGILYIIIIIGIVSAILNFVAYDQLKKQNKE